MDTTDITITPQILQDIVIFLKEYQIVISDAVEG